MKTHFPNSKLFAAITLIGTAVGIVAVLSATEQKQARVTEAIHDVRLLVGQTAARSAAVNDTVYEGTAVRTGTDSRAELTFTDQTLTRLGANTVFSFGGAARTYDLGSGASAKIIAGDTVNIFNTVIVTIGGVNPASVFTNHPNYTGFGGNGSRTGTFAGAGANNPQPLSNAPPFGP
ncbi:MAG TPA: hypothetical protein VGQ95_11310 [Chthoniobacterales bacterium]|nr:hypothetical protein [Chthoniobacterales bacterium]